MKWVVYEVKWIVDLDVFILIFGEIGIGKEMIVRVCY